MDDGDHRDDGDCRRGRTGCATLAPALKQLGADRWYRTGFRGQGMKVVVLDTGFRGFRNFFGRTLPQSTYSRSFRTDGDMEVRDSQHGIYCAEVIHAIAPDADIFLASWQPESPESLIGAIRWARSVGANIVSCSVIMPSWSDGEGGGPIHEELRRVIGDGNSSGDLLAVACAGNVAERHWYGPFRGAPAACTAGPTARPKITLRHSATNLSPWSCHVKARQGMPCRS